MVNDNMATAAALRKRLPVAVSAGYYPEMSSSPTIFRSFSLRLFGTDHNTRNCCLVDHTALNAPCSIDFARPLAQYVRNCWARRRRCYPEGYVLDRIEYEQVAGYANFRLSGRRLKVEGFDVETC
ncbi:hypothetical protein CJ178_17570 [Rhodococcus sp. ACPA4]|nr:hypothetical protein CJ178_17570 [Rhodococcus sp. ACPA4]